MRISETRLSATSTRVSDADPSSTKANAPHIAASTHRNPPHPRFQKRDRKARRSSDTDVVYEARTNQRKDQHCRRLTGRRDGCRKHWLSTLDSRENLLRSRSAVARGLDRRRFAGVEGRAPAPAGRARPASAADRLPAASPAGRLPPTPSGPTSTRC